MVTLGKQIYKLVNNVVNPAIDRKAKYQLALIYSSWDYPLHLIENVTICKKYPIVHTLARYNIELEIQHALTRTKTLSAA